MATLKNQNGTSGNDVLTYDKGGNGVVYHTGAGVDKVNILADAISLVDDAGGATISITGGAGHSITGTGTSAENITIDGANAVEARLDSGKDIIVIKNSNGRKATGGNAGIRGGSWTDTFTTEANVQSYQLYGEAGGDVFNVNGGKYINFWGGAANDTFIVKGGTSNKLYGGDSADKFEIYAAKQNMILGYGNDIVNIYAGDDQQIKGNLGINQINLLAGSGHIITADIDLVASQKVGMDVGYGVDKVLIDGATKVTANLGDGKDIVEIKSGSGHKIYTEGWGDTVTISGDVSDSFINTGMGYDTIYVQGGKNITILAGDGEDTFYVDWEKLQGKVELTRDSDYYQYETDFDNVIHINESLSLFKRTYDAKKDILTLSQEGTGKAISVTGNNHTFVFADHTKTFDQLCVPAEVSYTVDEGETKSINATMDIVEVYVNGGHATEIKTGKANDYLEVNGGLVDSVDLGAGKNVIVLNEGELKGVLTTGNNHITINGGSYTSEGFGNVFHYASGTPVGSNTYYINGGTNLELSSGWGTNEYYIDCSKLSCDVVIHRPYYKYGVYYGCEDAMEFDASSRDVIYLQNANSEDFTRSWDAETKVLTLSNGQYSISFDNYMYEGIEWHDDYGGSDIPVKVVFADKTIQGKDLYTYHLDSGKLESFIGTDPQNNVCVDGAEVGEIKLLGTRDILTINSGYVGTVDTSSASIASIKINGGSIDTITGGQIISLNDGSIDTIAGDFEIYMYGGSVNTVRLMGEPPVGSSYNERESFKNGTIDELHVEGKRRSITIEKDMVVNKYYCVNSNSYLADYSKTPLTAYLGENGSVGAYGDNGTYYGGNGVNGISLSGSNNIGYGGAGNDSISVSGTGNIAYGDEGNDTLTLSSGAAVTAVGGKGTDSYNVYWSTSASNMLIDNSTADARDFDDVRIYNLKSTEYQASWDEADKILKLSKGKANLYLRGITSTNLDKITFYDGITKSYGSLVAEATKTSGLLEEIKAVGLVLATEGSEGTDDDGYIVKEGETKSIIATEAMAEIYVNGGHATEIKTGMANDYLEVNGGLAENVNLGAGKNLIVLNAGELKGVASVGNTHITINGGSYSSEGFGYVFEYVGGYPVGSNTYNINGGTNLKLNSGWGINEYYIDCSKLSCDVVINRPYNRYGVLYGCEDLHEFDASSRDTIYLRNANFEDFTRSWDPETKVLTMSNGQYNISFDNYIYDGIKWYDDYGGDAVPVKVVFDDKTIQGKEIYTHYFNSGKVESFIGSDPQNNVCVDGAEVGEIRLLGNGDILSINSGNIGTVEAVSADIKITDGSIDTIVGDVTINMEGGSVDTIRLVGEQPPKDSYYNERETFKNGTIDELYVEGKRRTITIEKDMVVNKYYCVNSNSSLTDYSQTPLTAYLGENGGVAAYGKNGTYYGGNSGSGISLRGSNNIGYGGAGNDRIGVYGTDNIGYGYEGDDRMELNGNIVTAVGGKGTDYYNVYWRKSACNMLIDNSTAGTRDFDDVWINDLNPAECQTSWDDTDHILKLSKGAVNLYLKGITSTNLDKITFLYDTYYNTVTKSYSSLVSEATKVSGLLDEIKAASLIMAMESADEMVTSSLMEENKIMVFGSK